MLYSNRKERKKTSFTGQSFYLVESGGQKKLLKRMKIILVLLVISMGLIAETTTAQALWSGPFEFKRTWSYEKAIRGILLKNGTVVFYFEQTRPATQEEKAKRLEEFERQWKELEAKAKELEKKEELFFPRFPLYAIVSEFFKEAVKSGMQIAYSLGKNHVLNAPVVTKAGFNFIFKEGVQKQILLDLEDAYGPESWQRMPTDAINIRASDNGRFVALETEKGGIALYELEDDTISLMIRMEGTHPFGFSPDSLHMFVTLEKGIFRIYRLPPKRDIDVRLFLPEFLLIKKVELEIPKGTAITDVVLSDRHLLVLTWRELIVYDWQTETIHRLTFNSYGGRSLLLTSDEEAFVAKMDGTLAKVDLKEMRSYDFKMDRFDLLNRHRVYFHKLVSISLDKRFIAALYDPGLIPPEGTKSWSGSTTDESRLFIWDLSKGEVVWRSDKRLESITGGFGYHSPAWFSEDWNYLLLNLRDGGLELLKLTKAGM